MGNSFRKKLPLLAALALACGATPVAAAIKTWEAESDSLIIFTHASDWRCLDRDGCSTCRNVSADESEIIIDHGGDRAKDHYFIPAGYALQVCHPADLPL